MTLGDVLPAIQEGTIDGALAGMAVYSPMHYWDAAKYVTETGQPFIFSMAFLSKKWFDSLPKNLQTIITMDAAKDAAKLNPWAIDFNQRMRKIWMQHGGKLIELSPQQHAKMMKLLAGVGVDVAKRKPKLKHALDVFAAAAKRTRK
jgi:TRAP-type C4-dicarboxylate transport system substrate-binding protein